ncbi:MAG: TraV family lipoprotein [Candidatus Micrarchaeaceae archaeon]
MRKKKISSLVILSTAAILALGSCAPKYNVKDSHALIKLPEKTVVTDLNSSTVPQTEFDKARTKLEMSIIHQTPTPIWVPPVMAKVLIMPYVDKSGALHSYQYVYEQLTEGHWLIGRYLANKNQNIIERPLSDNTQSALVQQPLSAPQGIAQTPGVITQKPQNSQTAKQNSSFFNGGAPKKTIDTTIPTTGGSSNNERYFQNTVNAMKSGG